MPINEQSLLSLNDFLIDKFEKVKESTLYCCTNLIGMIEVGAYGNVFKFIKNHFFFKLINNFSKLKHNSRFISLKYQMAKNYML